MYTPLNTPPPRKKNHSDKKILLRQNYEPGAKLCWNLFFPLIILHRERNKTIYMDTYPCESISGRMS